MLLASLVLMVVNGANAHVTTDMEFETKIEIDYIGRTIVSADLVVNKESEEAYSVLKIFAREPESFKEQEAKLQEKYPGKSPYQQIGAGVGKPVVKVGALDLSVESEWIQNEHTPGFAVEIILNKEQTEKIRAAEDLGLKVDGELRGDFKEVYYDRISVRGDACEKLTTSGNSFEAIASALPAVWKELEKVETETPELIPLLKKEILGQCFILERSAPVTSFAELIKSEAFGSGAGEIDAVFRGDMIFNGRYDADYPKTLTSVEEN